MSILRDTSMVNDACPSETPIAALQKLFGDFCLKKFFADFLHRLPVALPGVGGSVRALGSWETLEAILQSTDVDLMVVREGQQVPGTPVQDIAAARDYVAAGCTILVRHAECHQTQLRALANQFQQVFRAPVNIHLYATPPATFGFSWHYDAEDVFILQTSGEKEYFLRKNTVNPWPLEETIPSDMHYERELMPLSHVVLKADDLLYIPCGYWHRAEAKSTGETAISLAIGVMSRCALDALDMLRPRLLSSLLCRQRLPLSCVLGGAVDEGLKSEYQQLMGRLAADLTAMLTAEEFIAALLGAASPECDSAST